MRRSMPPSNQRDVGFELQPACRKPPRQRTDNGPLDTCQDSGRVISHAYREEAIIPTEPDSIPCAHPETFPIA